jgi:hypothetical protein
MKHKDDKGDRRRRDDDSVEAEVESEESEAVDTTAAE